MSVNCKAGELLKYVTGSIRDETEMEVNAEELLLISCYQNCVIPKDVQSIVLVDFIMVKHKSLYFQSSVPVLRVLGHLRFPSCLPPER